LYEQLVARTYEESYQLFPARLWVKVSHSNYFHRLREHRHRQILSRQRSNVESNLDIGRNLVF
jgi:hypothetical protein